MLGATPPRCPLRLELVDDEWSSLGAMMGSRCGACFLEDSPRLSSCITKVPVVVIEDES